MPRYDAILFDLDGTLVDHDSAAHQAAASLIRQYGLAGNENALIERWFIIEHEEFSRFERGEISHAQQRLNRMSRFFDTPLSDDESRQRFEVFASAYRAHWRAYPDAAAALTAAEQSGAQVAIMTNGARDMQAGKLAATGLESASIRLIPTAELSCAKPNPQAYHEALALMGVRPERAVMIGDNYINDVQAARAAGLHAAHLSDPAKLLELLHTEVLVACEGA
ncbi:Pyrophosphatase PpaX [Corynebacterium ciconiae DSM 44920]|uniref:HAD family hydrolase n=1 Tax=Corynebacterium ciconiae TaxID=227319 RepID=UPI0003650D65|nr:HAD family hydrolase [Corynebacterium ciconiae]WKD60215.1 Pyrophosphatase PpaX [Corynebacterium ciconiae DSM 44920]